MHVKEIAKLLDNDPTFHQLLSTKVICAKNQLKSNFWEIKRPSVFVSNTENSNSSEDSHWVCVVFPGFCPGAVFFDPLGNNPCREICGFIENNSDLWYRFLDICLQKWSDSCGQWRLYFVLNLLSFNNFYQMAKIMKRVRENDVVMWMTRCPYQVDYLLAWCRVSFKLTLYRCSGDAKW